MKVTVNKPTVIEVTHVEIDVPIEGEDDIPADFPLRAGDRWQAKVEIEGGQIAGWPEKAGTRHLYAKPRDGGTYRLLGSDGKVVAELKESYVPNLCIPGQYGDYIDLEIDHNGRVTNWPKAPDVCEFFKDSEDD